MPFRTRTLGDGREVVNELEQLFIFLIARIVLGEGRQPWECIRFCGLLLLWIEEEPKGESERKGAVLGIINKAFETLTCECFAILVL